MARIYESMFACVSDNEAGGNERRTPQVAVTNTKRIRIAERAGRCALAGERVVRDL